MSEHRETCASVKYAAEYEKQRAAFDTEVKTYSEQWPNYCRDCGGWGGHISYYDPSPPGISLSPGYMQDYDPCTGCVEQDKCPRCGEIGLTLQEPENADDYFECSSCNWIDGKTEGVPQDGPYPEDCDCWEEEWEAQR